MSNYDMPLDMSSRNSLSLIINRIAKNSTVLEFGPANGRMTKYLKETLGCTVYAVELDKQSAKDAAEFCEEILIGDIENLDWLRKYKDISFDYIIFADVLEHLYNPENVLIKAKTLLKVEGSILMSLPNIAHNSIIMDLMDDKFTYRETGLLDNTHIRFFTKNTLEQIVTRCGLEIAFEAASYVEPSNTEFEKSYSDIDISMAWLLINREFGEAYQFIFEAKHKAADLEIDFIQQEVACLYIDTGSGFNEAEKITTTFNYNIDKSINFSLETKLHNVCGVRVDPLNTSISIKVESLLINTKDLTHKIKQNGLLGRKGEFSFLHNTPMLEVSFGEVIGLDSVSLNYEYLSKNYDIESQTQDVVIEQLQGELNSLRVSLDIKEHTVDEQDVVIEQLQGELNSLRVSLDIKEHTVDEQDVVIEQLHEELNRKTIYIKDLELHAKNLLELAHSLRLINRFKRRIPQKVKVIVRKIYQIRMRLGNFTRKAYHRIRLNGLLFTLRQFYNAYYYKHKAISFETTGSKAEDISNIFDGISIVIPTYNGIKDLVKLIPQLLNQKGFEKIEIVIVDSSSEDGTSSFIKSFPGIRFIPIAQEDFSHSHARNLGFEQCSSEIVLFLVQDALPTSSYWLHSFVNIFNKNKLSALSCCQVVNSEADMYTCYGINQFNNMLGLSTSTPATKISKKYISHYARELSQLDNVSCLVKANVFAKYKFRGKYAEDLDLGMRLLQGGYLIGVTSEVTVIHSHTRSSYYYMKREMVESEVINMMFNNNANDVNVDIKVQISGFIITSILLSKLIQDVAQIKGVLKMEQFRTHVTTVIEGLLSVNYQLSEFNNVETVLLKFDKNLLDTLRVFTNVIDELNKNEFFYLVNTFNYEALSFMDGMYSNVDEKIRQEYILFIINMFAVNVGVLLFNNKQKLMNESKSISMLLESLGKGV